MIFKWLCSPGCRSESIKPLDISTDVPSNHLKVNFLHLLPPSITDNPCLFWGCFLGSWKHSSPGKPHSNLSYLCQPSYTQILCPMTVKFQVKWAHPSGCALDTQIYSFSLPGLFHSHWWCPILGFCQLISELLAAPVHKRVTSTMCRPRAQKGPALGSDALRSRLKCLHKFISKFVLSVQR